MKMIITHLRAYPRTVTLNDVGEKIEEKSYHDERHRMQIAIQGVSKDEEEGLLN